MTSAIRPAILAGLAGLILATAPGCSKAPTTQPVTEAEEKADDQQSREEAAREGKARRAAEKENRGKPREDE